MVSHRGSIRLRPEVPMRVVTVCVGAMLAFRVLHSLHAGIELNSNTPTWFSQAMGGLNDTPFLFLGQLCFATWCFDARRERGLSATCSAVLIGALT